MSAVRSRKRESPRIPLHLLWRKCCFHWWKFSSIMWNRLKFLSPWRWLRLVGGLDVFLSLWCLPDRTKELHDQTYLTVPHDSFWVVICLPQQFQKKFGTTWGNCFADTTPDSAFLDKFCQNAQEPRKSMQTHQAHLQVVAMYAFSRCPAKNWNVRHCADSKQSHVSRSCSQSLSVTHLSSWATRSRLQKGRRHSPGSRSHVLWT